MVTTGSLGKVLTVTEVTTPKVPPPPPRRAQKRSVLTCALAVTKRPSGVTTSRARTCDHVSELIYSHDHAVRLLGHSDTHMISSHAVQGAHWRVTSSLNISTHDTHSLRQVLAELHDNTLRFNLPLPLRQYKSHPLHDTPHTTQRPEARHPPSQQGRYSHRWCTSRRKCSLSSGASRSTDYHSLMIWQGSRGRCSSRPGAN